jgi:hypothetical protein
MKCPTNKSFTEDIKSKPENGACYYNKKEYAYEPVTLKYGQLRAGKSTEAVTNCHR